MHAKMHYANFLKTRIKINFHIAYKYAEYFGEYFAEYFGIVKVWVSVHSVLFH